MVKEVTNPALQTYELPGYFFTDDGLWVKFRCPAGGKTTPNSSYPRTELRQMKADGKRDAAWSNKSSTHNMRATMKFTELPNNPPNVVGMQVHGGTDDVTVLRLEGSNLYVTKGDNPHFELIDGGYVLGTPMTITIVAAAGGGFYWFRDGTQVAVVPGVKTGCYFKAGAYVQAASGGGFGETQFYKNSLELWES